MIIDRNGKAEIPELSCALLRVGLLKVGGHVWTKHEGSVGEVPLTGAAECLKDGQGIVNASRHPFID
jgi:hypothetical protein